MRYVSKSVFIGYDEDGDVSMTADEIHIEDDEPTFTGLLDSSGNQIHRYQERIKFGFVPE